jgi:hypothetical protein
MVCSLPIFSQEPDYSKLFGIPDDMLNKIMGVYLKPKFLEDSRIVIHNFHWGPSAFLPYDCYAIYPVRIEEKYVLSFIDFGPVVRIERIKFSNDIYELTVVLPFWEISGIVYFKFSDDNMVHVWDGEFTGAKGLIGDQILFKLSGPGEPDNRKAVKPD